MDKSKLKREPLLVEWLKDGKWIGHYAEKYVKIYRDYAERELQRNPDRYIYINQRLRISYYEGSIRPWSSQR